MGMQANGQQRAVIIGAGPAGLTAAVEFKRRTCIAPLVLEASHEIGGISRTVEYKGNRLDLGPHRFFSKSDRVVDWWRSLMPIAGGEEAAGAAVSDSEQVLLVVPRQTRIYFLGRFFDYPITLSTDTIRKMGAVRTLRAGFSYLRTVILPQREERTLEDFLINRFGRQLYRMFFQSYTEKVWGVPCNQISAEWGAQRIKGLSLSSAVAHFLKKALGVPRAQGVTQKGTETSLIESFFYPKKGAGQMWELAADEVRAAGHAIEMGVTIDRILLEGKRIVAVEGLTAGGRRVGYEGEYFLSTMPVNELIRAMGEAVPMEVREIAEGLVYRDFFIIGVLASRVRVHEQDGSGLRDNWIYIHSPDVKLGRLNLFSNWSSAMTARPDTVWLGLEYFCNETDALWKMEDAELERLGREELVRIGIVNESDLLDSCVVRQKKAYPAYFGSYDRFDRIRVWLDEIENLFLVGRNGMHKYNNQDHSMLTAMVAVDTISSGSCDKANIWAVNTEAEYHEEKTRSRK